MQPKPDDIIEIRRLIYEDLQKSKRHALQLNADYGRWLIASLLLVHGAVIVFMAQSERLSEEVLPIIFWWNVSGLLLALLCGFFTWGNWSLHALLYEDVSPSMIYDIKNWPKFSNSVSRWISATHILGIIAGLLSAGCILGSAFSAHDLMSNRSHISRILAIITG